MQVRSEFIKSELLIWREGCEVIDRGDHISVKCLSNPNWRWGNLIITPNAPVPGDLQIWNRYFEAAFPEGRPHRMYVWDDPDGAEGDTTEFVHAGYRLQHDYLISTTELIAPPPPGLEVDYKEIDRPDEWEKVIVANAASFGPNISGYEDFVRGLLSIHRSMVSKGLGFWLCAYVDGELAGSCGVFNSGSFSRYQEVSVVPKFQNRGIASNLVHQTAARAAARGFATPFYLAVDIGTQAERIYRRLGFANLETTSSLRRLPEDEMKKDT